MMRKHARKQSLLCLSALACLLVTLSSPAVQTGLALPAIVARATDSISALLGASGRSQQPQVQQQPQLLQQQQVAPAPAAIGVAGSSLSHSEPQQQQWVASPANQTGLPSPGNTIQSQLNTFQAQAQRQLNQLVGAAASGNLSSTANRYGSNVLEVLSNVGKAIQQQIAGGGQIQIMNSATSGGLNTELANTKKNEYQSIVITDPLQQQQQPKQQLIGATNQTVNYREQSEQLRQEIQRRVGQLQQVVAHSMDLLKNNGDLIVRRLLEQLNHRLDQAKSKADKIISEPATNEVAMKALNTINLGLNNLNNIITNIVTKLELSAKEAGQQQAGGLTQRGAGPISSGPLILDPARFKINLHQLGQQFSSAISAVQQQRQLQQQQQQQPPAAAAATNQLVAGKLSN